LRECTLPTARPSDRIIITNLGVLDVALMVASKSWNAHGVTEGELRAATGSDIV
jgi:acyl CoA:acetate/3-ketoacid CoA transferase beta subunit